VTLGKVVTRKKPLGRRFLDTFIAGDGHSVGHYVVFEILVPAFRDLIADVVSQGVEKMVYGDARSSSRRTGARPGSGSNYVSYNRYSSSSPPWRGGDRREEPRPSLSNRARASHNFDEIILQTRPEALEVLDRMFDLVSRYGQVTVSELYDLVGLTGNFTDEKYGWTDLRGADAERVRDGYVLRLPKPEPLT